MPSKRATSVKMVSGWYREEKIEGVCPYLPGLYEWQIEGVGCYIGQYTHARRPRREYGLNVGRILANRPYRKNNLIGFRRVHHELAAAFVAGKAITLTLLGTKSRRRIGTVASES